MLLSDSIDVERAEERWRRVLGIFLRINGKTYSETYNMGMTISLNVSLFLIKYLKIKPSVAERLAYYEIYALFKPAYQNVVKESNYEIIQEGDVLDLVKLRTKEKFNVESDLEMAPQTYVHNSHGGFRVEFLNTYIAEVMGRGKRPNGPLIKDDFINRTTDSLGLSVANLSNCF